MKGYITYLLFFQMSLILISFFLSTSSSTQTISPTYALYQTYTTQLDVKRAMVSSTESSYKNAKTLIKTYSLNPSLEKLTDFEEEQIIRFFILSDWDKIKNKINSQTDFNLSISCSDSISSYINSNLSFIKENLSLPSLFSVCANHIIFKKNIQTNKEYVKIVPKIFITLLHKPTKIYTRSSLIDFEVLDDD